MNLSETEHEFRLDCELPGARGEDIDISVTGDTVTLKGEVVGPEDVPAAAYHRRERRVGSFSRVVTLPAAASGENVEAELTDGVLTVRLEKAPEVKPRKIEIK